MSLESIIRNLDITKIKSSSGKTFSQELVDAANLLRQCIQNSINHATIGQCISVSDLANIEVNGNSLKLTMKIEGAMRPSIFNQMGYTNKNANVFWLINDGFTVKNTWAFNGFAHPERWIYREAEKYVEKGIQDFNSQTKYPIKVTVKKPSLYYG